MTAKGLVVIGDEVEVYERVWGWLLDKALSPQQTTRFLRDKLESLAGGES